MKNDPLSPPTIQMEKWLLGSILREPLTLLAARPLSPADFSEGAHALLLEVLRQMAEDGLPLDLPTLTTRLERSGQLQRAGGPAYLADLARSAPDTVSVHSAAELVERIQAGRAAPNVPAGSIPLAQMAGSPGEVPPRTAVVPTSTAGEPLGRHLREQSAVGPAASPGSRRDGGGTLGASSLLAVPERPAIQRIDALLSQSFAPTLWVVPDLLPEGLTLLAAKPKLGKSRLALGLALAVASGGAALGEIEVEPGTVLYLALEDSLKRLSERTQKLLGDEIAPPLLEVTTEWPRLDAGGLDQLEDWLANHPDARLVILDTLAKIRGARAGGSYAGDYSSLEGAQALAQRAGVAILVIHHTGKESRQDALDEVNATQGLAGVADNILVLRRQRGQAQAQLIGDGRELNGVDLWLRADPATGAWRLAEPPESQEAKTPERAEILRVLKASGEPLSAGQVAEALEKPIRMISQLLWKMERAGEVAKARYGCYTPPAV